MNLEINPAITNPDAEDEIREGLGCLLPEGADLFFEHGQWFVWIGPCAFSVVDTSQGLELEHL